VCGKLRTPRRPPSIFGARRGEIQDDLDPVSISAPTSWCASVVPCSVTAAMLTSRFGPICSIALGSKEIDRRCQLPFRASGSSSSLMAVRYTEPIRTFGRFPQGAGPRRLRSDYSRELRHAEWSLGRIFRSSNSQGRMSEEVRQRSCDVRFASQSRHWLSALGCQLSARTGLSALQQNRSSSIVRRLQHHRNVRCLS
jgi:hypothetical protein